MSKIFSPISYTDEAASSKASIVLQGDESLIHQCKLFLREEHMNGNIRTLHRRSGEFFRWLRTHYDPITDEMVRTLLYEFFEGVQIVKQNKKTAGFEYVGYSPSATKVSALLDALKAAASLDDRVDVPSWLDGRTAYGAPADIVSFTNGLLHVPTKQMVKYTPVFFGMNSLPFPYEPDAPEPKEWIKFLNAVWPDDQQSIECLQEWFGLLLTANTSHHKILFLIGPPRSGKGTISRVANALLGQHNCTGPTLGSLGGTFGLQPLIGKLLATVSDARLSERTDKGVIVERLLSISGEDSLSVDRKHATAWEGRLSTRIMILSNEMMRLTDSSGALASRFLVLRQVESWLSREDHGLFDRLKAEMPGILAWALAGLDRLTSRGRFVQPEAAQPLLTEIADFASPIKAFIRDRCVLGPDEKVAKADLFKAWADYRTDKGWHTSETAASFGAKLRSAAPKVGEAKPRTEDGGRIDLYTGIALKAPAAAPSKPQPFRDLF
jgi:putative DNA primase/helicase